MIHNKINAATIFRKNKTHFDESSSLKLKQKNFKHENQSLIYINFFAFCFIYIYLYVRYNNYLQRDTALTIRSFLASFLMQKLQNRANREIDQDSIPQILTTKIQFEI